MKRLIALFCCLCTMFTMAACGQKQESLTEKASEDLVAYLTDGAVTDTDPVMTINGDDVPASYYIYWVGNSISQLSYFYDALNLDEEFGENGTMADYIKESAFDYAQYYWVVDQHIDEYNLSLNESQEKELEAYADSLSDEILLYSCTNKEDQEQLYRNSLYEDLLRDKLFSEGGAYEISDEQIEEYIGDDVYLTIDYMYFGYPDSDGTNAEETKNKAQEVYTALENASPEAFDDVFTECAYMSGLYDLNYTFCVGNEGEDETLVNAAVDMNPGEIQIVETEYGVYVVCLLDLDTEALKDQFAETAFLDLTYEWQEYASVELTDIYDKIDIETIYSNLIALRAEIDGTSADESDLSVSDSIKVETEDSDVDVKIISS